MQTDVSDEKQVKRLVAETIRQFGQVDILVNNSGVSGPTSRVVDMDLAQWNETLAVDLTGSMVCAREVLKNMIERRTGNIINVVSEAGRSADGRSGYPFRAAYCCAKMGLIGLTETLSVEMGEYGIRVNALSPGPVVGERIVNVVKKRVAGTGKTFDEIMESLAANNSLKRLATEEECAAVAALPRVRGIECCDRSDHTGELRPTREFLSAQTSRQPMAISPFVVSGGLQANR